MGLRKDTFYGLSFECNNYNLIPQPTMATGLIAKQCYMQWKLDKKYVRYACFSISEPQRFFQRNCCYQYQPQHPHPHPPRLQQLWRQYRTTRYMSSNSTFSSDLNSQLRNMIKPFLLKCHPDVHVASSSKQINMTAVQNLNAYLDTISNISNVSNDRKKRKRKVERNEQMMSRRKVELTLPPPQLCINLSTYTNRIVTSNSNDIRVIQQLQRRLLQHTRQELLKLLRIAGLSDEVIEESSRDIHEVIVDDIFGSDYTYQDSPYTSASAAATSTESSGPTNTFRRAHNVRMTRNTKMRDRPKTPYEASRDQYVANIPWHNYQKLYDKAVAEMNADYYTRGLISKHPGRRRAMIARILSNIRIQKTSTEADDEPTISFVEQLVAFRRLTILLDSNFDKLQMEEFGQMWENSRIVLTEPRQYNTSRSALFKRKSAMISSSTSTTSSDGNSTSNPFVTGFSFTLHPNLSVTITIPIDFRDDELIDELDSNVWDFYNFIGDDAEDFFEQQLSA